MAFEYQGFATLGVNLNRQKYGPLDVSSVFTSTADLTYYRTKGQTKSEGLSDYWKDIVPYPYEGQLVSLVENGEVSVFKLVANSNGTFDAVAVAQEFELPENIITEVELNESINNLQENVNESINDLNDRIDFLANYEKIKIKYFNTNSNSSVEKGSTIAANSLQLSWEIEGEPTKILLHTYSASGEEVGVAKELDVSNRNYIIPSTISNNIEWELEVVGMDKDIAKSKVGISFLDSVWYGVIEENTDINNTIIDELIANKTITKSFQSSRQVQKFSVNAGKKNNKGLHIFFALPQAYGTPSFLDLDTNLAADFYYAKNITYNKTSTQYNIWLSTNTELGEMSIKVN